MNTTYKISIIGSAKPDSLASMLCEAFRELGHKVDIFDGLVSFDSGTRYKIIEKIGLAHFSLDYLIKSLPESNILIVTYRNLPFSWMHKVKVKLSCPFIVHYNGDHIGTLSRQELLYNKYDLYITKSKALHNVYCSLNLNSFLIDEATVDRLLIRRNGPYGEDISLFGSIYPYRLKILQLINSRVSLYCNMSKEIIRDMIPSHHTINNGFVHGNRKVEVVQKSSIILNPFHYLDNIDLTQKFFEFGGLNTPQLVPKTERLTELFGVEIANFIGYENPSEIQSKIDFLYLNYKDAEHISDAVFDIISTEHTYKNRVTFIINYYESIN